ncbi:MAG: hypothetical protein ACQ5SW_10360 [Sphaerochaetaceae bacterium]
MANGYSTYVSPLDRSVALARNIEEQKTARQQREFQAQEQPIRMGMMETQAAQAKEDIKSRRAGLRALKYQSMFAEGPEALIAEVERDISELKSIDPTANTRESEWFLEKMRSGQYEEAKRGVDRFVDLARAGGHIPSQSAPRPLKSVSGVDAEGRSTFANYDDSTGLYTEPGTNRVLSANEFKPRDQASPNYQLKVDGEGNYVAINPKDPKDIVSTGISAPEKSSTIEEQNLKIAQARLKLAEDQAKKKGQGARFDEIKEVSGYKTFKELKDAYAKATEKGVKSSDTIIGGGSFRTNIKADKIISDYEYVMGEETNSVSKSDKIPTIDSQKEYDSLEIGDEYIDKGDGKRYIKQ